MRFSLCPGGDGLSHLSIALDPNHASGRGILTTCLSCCPVAGGPRDSRLYFRAECVARCCGSDETQPGHFADSLKLHAGLHYLKTTSFFIA